MATADMVMAEKRAKVKAAMDKALEEWHLTEKATEIAEKRARIQVAVDKALEECRLAEKATVSHKKQR